MPLAGRLRTPATTAGEAAHPPGFVGPTSPANGSGGADAPVDKLPIPPHVPVQVPVATSGGGVPGHVVPQIAEPGFPPFKVPVTSTSQPGRVNVLFPRSNEGCVVPSVTR